MGIGTRNLFLLIIGWCLMLWHSPCSSMRTFLRQGETLKYPDQLFSEYGIFMLSFFDGVEDEYYPQTQNAFLGLFYNRRWNRPQWVADRNAQYLDGSANLTLGDDGSLQILYEGGRSFVLYSSQGPSNSSLVLQDNGNLVLREFSSDGSSRPDLWQSFNNPTDTLLLGMKLGLNNKTGKNLTLVSPSGSYTLGIDPAKTNQLVIWWLGDIYWTSGPWENGNFISSTGLSRNRNLNFDYVSNENGTYFTFSIWGNIFTPRLTLDSYGGLMLITSMNTTHLVQCNYPFYIDEGCAEKFPDCIDQNLYYYEITWGIMSRSGMKMSKNLTLDDCFRKCGYNCSNSCGAFAIVNGTECVIWSQESTFQKTSVSDGGHLIHVLTYRERKSLTWKKLALALGGAGLLIMVSGCCYVVAKRCQRKVQTRRKQKILLKEIGGDALPSSTKRKKEKNTHRELHIFSFKTIVSATNNFSDENQLGKGGYGPVYKGRLADGQEIAVKRLSSSSGQGLVEFKNEAILIAKLQHTNLVRLLGFCVQGEEKALVYEYMPNKSLDFFLFDSTRKKMLNWKKRFLIVEGIAQGLVYLHKYSRLKVIHRDLKASNILLDLEMNPKISDFGMARLLGPLNSEENTNRIVGTFGYMPPEYALQGTVSMKTDVFSFGILLLEIVSGRKNNSRYHPDHPLNLTGYAWTLWKEGKGVELIDPSLDESVPHEEVLKCIQVGLLCVQDQASSRPTMIDVVFMLSNESTQLSLPKKPAFFISTIAETTEEAQTQVETFSINELTMSNLEVR